MCLQLIQCLTIKQSWFQFLLNSDIPFFEVLSFMNYWEIRLGHHHLLDKKDCKSKDTDGSITLNEDVG